MKEMVYKYNWDSELLEYNTYKGYHYAVVSQGVFPCGYVEIPKDHPYYQKPYGKCDICCHGGLTFGDQLGDHLGLPTNTYWLGWDYGHYGDLTMLAKLTYRYANDKPKPVAKIITLTEEEFSEVLFSDETDD